MGWKSELDPVIKDYLNNLLKEVSKYKEAYSKANDIGRAQIWVALAILYRKITALEAAINEIKEKLFNEVEKEKLEKTLKKY